MDSFQLVFALTEIGINPTKLSAIWFDGKKDRDTATMVNGRRTKVERSHYTIVVRLSAKAARF